MGLTLRVVALSGEGHTKAEWRKAMRGHFYTLAGTHKPASVLHHPHVTDTGTWTGVWNELVRVFPSVENYLGSGRYWNGGENQRSPLREVLAKTKLGPSIDFVFGEAAD